MFQTFAYNQSHVVMETIGDSHIAIFYPLPFFNLDVINKAYTESEKFKDLSLHWVPLGQIVRPEFHSKYLTAFDFQIICYAAPRVIEKLQKEQSDEFKYPEYAVILGDDRDYWKTINEVIYYGHFMSGKEKWCFYKAFDLEFPSK